MFSTARSKEILPAKQGVVVLPDRRSAAEQPLSTLLPYRSYDESTATFINSDSHGFIVECSPLLGGSQEIVAILEGHLNEGFEKGTTVQFLHWASPRIGHQLAHWAATRSRQGGVFQTLAQRRVEHLAKGAHHTLIPSLHYTLKHFRVFVAVSRPGRASAMDLDVMEQKREALCAVLTSMGLGTRIVDPDMLISLMDEWLKPEFSVDALEPFPGRWNRHDYLDQQFAPIGMKLSVQPDRLDINDGEAEISAMSVRQFPDEWAQWLGRDLIGALMKPQLSLPCPALTVLTLTYGDDEKNAMRAATKHANATRQSETGILKYLPIIGKQRADWEYARDQIEKGQKLVQVSYEVVLQSQPGKGAWDRRQLAALYKSHGWTLVHDRYVQLQSLLAALPLVPANGIQKDMVRLGRTKTIFTSNCANLALMQGEWQGTEEPYLLLFGRRGEPLRFNPFDNKEGNYNVAIAGASGTGKSVVMQEYDTALLGAGGRVFKLDVGRSTKHQCQLLGGTFVEFSFKDAPCLNPFTRIDPMDPDMVEESKQLIRLMCQRMCRRGGNTSDIENAFIEKAVNRAWETAGQAANFTVVQQFLQQQGDERAKDLALMLTSFAAGGAYAPFFEGPCNLDFDNDYIVFELEELKNKPDLQSVVFMLLMYLVTTEMYYGNRQRRIALEIDEAWDLLRDGNDGEFVEGVARRARKYVGQLVTGVQGVNDYYASAAATAAFENSDWVLLLGQKKESIAQLKKSSRIELDEPKEALLKSVHTVHGQYSEIMIMGPQGYAVGRLLLDPFSEKLYSSMGHEYAEVESYLARGLSIEEAVQRAVENDKGRALA